MIGERKSQRKAKRSASLKKKMRINEEQKEQNEKHERKEESGLQSITRRLQPSAGSTEFSAHVASDTHIKFDI